MICGPKVSVTRQTIARAPDSFGTYTNVLTNAETFPAVLRQMTAKEAIIYSKYTVTSLFKLYCDYRKADSTARSFKEQDKIVYGSRTFNIIGIENPFFKNCFYVLDLLESR